jgi:hypothetical protein
MVPEWAYTTNGAGGQDPQDERRGKGNGDTATWGNCAAVLKRTHNSEAGKSSGEAQEAEQRAVKLYGEKERLINVKKHRGNTWPLGRMIRIMLRRGQQRMRSAASCQEKAVRRSAV